MSVIGLFPHVFVTKDTATVTDWMLHTVLVSLSERVHVCVKVSFCGAGSFMLFCSREAEREGKRDRLHHCSVLNISTFSFYCCFVPIF